MTISGGENPQNLSRVISKITGKAREHLSVHPHDGTWNSVKALLLEKCEDPRTVDMIQTNIQMMRKHSTYADLLERIQRELYLIRGKYIKLNPTINENHLKNIMKVYENTARMTVLQTLPEHLTYLYEATGGLDSLREMLIKLELHGKTNSRKSTSNTTLKPAATMNNFKGTPPHHVPVLNYRQPHIMPHQPHWSRNVPNQQQWHQHFKAQQQPAPIINKYDTDVTMRSRNTENTGKGPQINIGRGRVVRELYNQEIHQDDEIVYDSEGNAYKRICEPYPTQDVPPGKRRRIWRRILIDTGSSRSFMNPATYRAYFDEIPVQPEKFEVKTAHALSQHEGNKYNILFGLDILRQAGMEIRGNQLKLGNNTIELNYNSEDIEIDLENLFQQYNKIFTIDVTDSVTSKVKHEIKLTDDSPVYQRPFRLPQTQRKEVRKQLKKLLKENVIRPSDSPWASPVHLVSKKPDSTGHKKFRLVIDYRKLNEKTRSDRYPLPNIEDILTQLNNCKYFSTIDLTSGYHQIPMDNNSIEKTAFITPEGHYEFLRMPFGLKNAPATFQRMMNDILKGLIGNICLVYLDDIIIYSENKKQHLERLKKVFDALQRANLKINKNKCKFLKTEVKFLGHKLTPQGIRPTQDKIEAITKFPLPRTVKETKSFLGLIGYYRKFIPNMSKIIKPLTNLTKKADKFIITDEVKRAFKQSKDLLTNAPILSYPDYNSTFTLTTDASDKALGAVLSQNQHPISYASRTLSETERRYNTTEKELLAVLWACQHFRPYIYGRKFNLETDHQPLTWLSKLKEPNAKLTRWRLRLQEYDYDIKHTKGRENKVADALSRIELQNNESNAATVHSNNDDDETGIPIVDGFAHSRKNRIFLQESPTPKWKREKNDVYIKIPLVNFDTEFSKNWKRKNVDKNSLKLKRYTEILTEINDREQQLKLMKSAHENNDAHIGSTLMYETLKKQYYWKKLKDDVLKYVHDCSICQRNKYDRRPPKTPLEYTITPEAPLQIWHIDTLVIDGTQYLTAIDKFTKYFAAEKIEGNDSISYIRSLTKIIKYLGKPKHVIHDPDKLMNSLTFKEHLTNLLSIDVHQTSIRHHTSNSDREPTRQ
ncbi:Retrovirus-related Pol polyprotein from transposon 17.6 [Eumeta japonica]|uniref:RNA-directed DNA polymerase n=1 Tax=Eumeta variegata TaxID=151549 RepID=A0A4C1UB68_EUMVA|nr:Retrovirus-related Pol polyprotein from transposon 17.6 [Eumeta japonica]